MKLQQAIIQNIHFRCPPSNNNNNNIIIIIIIIIMKNMIFTKKIKKLKKIKINYYEIPYGVKPT